MFLSQIRKKLKLKKKKVPKLNRCGGKKSVLVIKMFCFYTIWFQNYDLIWFNFKNSVSHGKCCNETFWQFQNIFFHECSVKWKWKPISFAFDELGFSGGKMFLLEIPNKPNISFTCTLYAPSSSASAPPHQKISPSKLVCVS